jgi:hypothetical protein
VFDRSAAVSSVLIALSSAPVQPTVELAAPSLARSVAIGLASVLVVLSAIHVYWAAGGERGIRVVVPEVGGRPSFNPGLLATMGVAVALAAAAVVVLARAAFSVLPLSASAIQGAVWVLAALFLARALGNFHSVGFAKTIRGTAFARWDDRLFSPLCLTMGAGLLWLAIQ